MPELPEVEILVRHLQPALKGRTIRSVEVRRPRVSRPNTPADLNRLIGCRIQNVSRRGKLILFHLLPPQQPPVLRSASDGGGSTLNSLSSAVLPTEGDQLLLTAHLGMTGRMYLLKARDPLPKHAAIVLNLGRHNFVFEDTRYFGRFTLYPLGLDRLGPEPLSDQFTPELLASQLAGSRQAIKVKLLDQGVVAGVGNIYASEALFRAGIAPQKMARRLTRPELQRLTAAIRAVLADAIAFGSTVPLDFPGADRKNALFYYGSTGQNSYHERLLVYDRADRPCPVCQTLIKRVSQASRSTYYCPACQPRRPGKKMHYPAESV